MAEKPLETNDLLDCDGRYIIGKFISAKKMFYDRLTEELEYMEAERIQIIFEECFKIRGEDK